MTFGIIGLILVLAAFGLYAFKMIKGEGTLYFSLNLFGAIGLSVYAFQAGNWIFLILETIWGIFAGIKLIARLVGKMELPEIITITTVRNASKNRKRKAA